MVSCGAEDNASVCYASSSRRLPCAATILRPILGLTVILAIALSLGAFGDSGPRHRTHAEIHLQNSRAGGGPQGSASPGMLADATVWPDTIKNPLYEDGDTPLFRLAHPAHDTYHYTNVAFQVPRYDLSPRRAHERHRPDHARVHARPPRHSKASTPREALRMLAHLVGDVHQPLHSGNLHQRVGRSPLRAAGRPDYGWATTGGNALFTGPRIASTSTPTGTRTS